MTRLEEVREHYVAAVCASLDDDWEAVDGLRRMVEVATIDAFMERRPEADAMAAYAVGLRTLPNVVPIGMTPASGAPTHEGDER